MAKPGRYIIPAILDQKLGRAVVCSYRKADLPYINKSKIRLYRPRTYRVSVGFVCRARHKIIPRKTHGVNDFAKYIIGRYRLQVSGMSVGSKTSFYVIIQLKSLEDVGISLNLEHCCGSCKVVPRARQIYDLWVVPGRSGLV